MCGTTEAKIKSSEKAAGFSLAWLFIPVLRFYRYAISPLLGNNCRFYPSCSQYAEAALKTHGLLAGSWLTIKRVSRCHPWHEGGFDPVPGSINNPDNP